MHKSVLLQEVVEGLAIRQGETLVDGTLGSAGHASEFCKFLGGSGVLIGIDKDKDALTRSREVLSGCVSKTYLLQGDFREMDSVLQGVGITEVDKVLLDLGLSSNQLEESGRGFSFKRDEPLLMTLSDNIGKETLTAERVVNEWSEEQIEIVIRGYGEERYSRRIANAIVEARAEAHIQTTTELVKIIESAVPKVYNFKRIHPATKTFQALRIAVNDEIDALNEGLLVAYSLLKPKGRIAIISFHSTEDRVVKRFFKDRLEMHGGTIHTKKPITASKEELENNPRARSAKLRIFEKHD
ncbi:MAG: 16S rRNA (cytosine(1402)-N(4))-methyltransferase RsmH [Parcubacteria group bacterium]|nr:16S rRNA (cytosine(1402)-N(4))-methyltransferase RsmH [Parcubacteria group bacterium]